MATTSRDKVRKYRERQRARGLRVVAIWLPDVKSPDFIAEARRQSMAVAAADRETDDQDFVDSVSALNETWTDEFEAR